MAEDQAAFRKHVFAAGAKLGRGQAEMERICEILRDNWFDTPESLGQLTEKVARELEIPLRLVHAIRDELGLNQKTQARGERDRSPQRIRPQSPLRGDRRPMSPRRAQSPRGQRSRDGYPRKQFRDDTALELSERKSSTPKAGPKTKPEWLGGFPSPLREYEPSGFGDYDPESVEENQKKAMERHIARQQQGRVWKQQEVNQIRISNGRWETVDDPWRDTSYYKRQSRAVIPVAATSRSIAGMQFQRHACEAAAEIAVAPSIAIPEEPSRAPTSLDISRRTDRLNKTGSNAASITGYRNGDASLDISNGSMEGNGSGFGVPSIRSFPASGSGQAQGGMRLSPRLGGPTSPRSAHDTLTNANEKAASVERVALEEAAAARAAVAAVVARNHAMTQGQKDARPEPRRGNDGVRAPSGGKQFLSPRFLSR